MKSKKWNRRILALVMSLVILFMSFDMPALNVSAQTSNGQYIVTFKNDAAKERFAKDKNKNKKVRKNFERQTSVVAELTASDIAELTANTDVLYIEPDSNIEILSTGKPDKNNRDVRNIQKGTQEVPRGIADVVGAANLNKYDGKRVKVAVFDTGISNHEDLKISGGVSFVDYTSSYSDDNGHGTHVAGTIAANNNKLGVVGVAPNAEIYAVKILNKNGGGNYSNIIAALEWAINNNIDIINMSLGGSVYSMALHEAVQRAAGAGIIIVAAAGNNGEGADTMTYPAKYPEVVSVGAVSENYKAAGFSSRGSELDIVAPGTAVLSTLNDGSYAALSGTSMAAPHVAGALTALKSKNKNMTSFELVNRIYETATPLGNRNTYGYGFLNFAYAAGEADGPIISVPADEITVYPDEEDDFEYVPIDTTFNIIDFDVRINEYKEKLIMLRDTAYKNGDIELSKEINERFEELFKRDSQLHELPENYIEKKNDSEAESNSILVNSYFASNSNNFYELENDYSSCADYYYAIIENKIGGLIYDAGSVSAEPTFDIGAYNARIGGYKQQLIMLRDTAYDSGDFELSTEISGKLERLDEIYSMLYNLPENSAEAEINAVFADKADHFHALENEYLSYVDYYANHQDPEQLLGSEMGNLAYNEDYIVSSSSFDITSYNARINEYKEQLTTLRDTASAKDDIGLSTIISDKLAWLTEFYEVLNEIPDNYKGAAAIETMFADRADHFQALESEYIRNNNNSISWIITLSRRDGTDGNRADIKHYVQFQGVCVFKWFNRDKSIRFDFDFHDVSRREDESVSANKCGNRDKPEQRKAERLCYSRYH